MNWIMDAIDLRDRNCRFIKIGTVLLLILVVASWGNLNKLRSEIAEHNPAPCACPCQTQEIDR